MPVIPTPAELYSWLQDPAHMHGVLGYRDEDGHPDSAFVAFSATGHLDIIFGTSDISRKFRLIHSDPRVSFNVTDKELRQTVQIRGSAHELGSTELGIHERTHYHKLGESSRRFRYLPDQHFFIVRPSYLRFSDCLEEPWTQTVLIGSLNP